MTNEERWDVMPEFIGIKDFMNVTGLNRKAADRIVSMKSFPTLPRVPKGKIIIPKAAAREWIENYRRGTK